MQENRPDLSFNFGTGYSMEHPDMKQALRFLKNIGSPSSEYLQCDGMKKRTAEECRQWVLLVSEEGVKHLNFTFYGLPEYHDVFAGRKGDFSSLILMMATAQEAGLTVSAGIPLTKESAPQADRLLALLKSETSCSRFTLFVPHEEGRGVSLQDIRFSEEDLEMLSPEAMKLFNRTLYRPEREWVTGNYFTEETRRTLLISLLKTNIDRYEAMSPGEIIAETEALDEAYYNAFPTLPELARTYGDPKSTRFYRLRDLFYHYRRLYAAEHHVTVYDVTDERQSGSRRY